MPIKHVYRFALWIKLIVIHGRNLPYMKINKFHKNDNNKCEKEQLLQKHNKWVIKFDNKNTIYGLQNNNDNIIIIFGLKEKDKCIYYY